MIRDIWWGMLFGASVGIIGGVKGLAIGGFVGATMGFFISLMGSATDED